MQNDTINKNIVQKIIWFLQHFKDKDLTNLQINSMSKTWDNDEDKAWDIF